MSEHTPTPWTPEIVNHWPESQEKANQEFMLRAVNAYDRDQEIKKGLLTALYKLRHELKYNKRHLKFWAMADSAITQAEAL